MTADQHITDQDRADLRAAADLKKDGERLRRRVLARIRQRKHRAAKENLA